MPDHIPEVGAPDPQLKTSPILDEDEDAWVGLETETGVCYFNDVAYPIGQFVRSGAELLHCEERGLWVRKGDIEP